MDIEGMCHISYTSKRTFKFTCFKTFFMKIQFRHWSHKKEMIFEKIDLHCPDVMDSNVFQIATLRRRTLQIADNIGAKKIFR